MPTPSCQLILGSASPRRKELLKWSWLPFTVMPSEAEEASHEQDPEKYVVDLARLKARDVFERSKSSRSFPIVIGSDTIVVLEGAVLEKPKDKMEARSILQRLSGKKHVVHTAVCFVCAEKESSFVEKTTVAFDPIPKDVLELYLKTGESMDKAGAYGVQGAALSFVASLEGSYSNVVGFPLNSAMKRLEELVRELFPDVENWRDCFEEA